MGVNNEWGFWSMPISGRVGYQCSNYWRKLIDGGQVEDENYVVNNKGKRRMLKKAEIEKNGSSDDYFDRFRRFQFTVKEDRSGTFKDLPALHPKAPNAGKRKKDKKKRKKKRIKEEDGGS